MQKFKRKSLYLALVAAVSSVGIANTASAAVHVNSNGLGQVLIYPYYTTRNGMNTYLSVVNTTASSKAVKVRFTEGKNSREVLDFNLYLSPHDMWTAALENTANGARLVTRDKSCTAAPIPEFTDPSGQKFNAKDFVDFAYIGAAREGINSDGGDGATGTNTLDRTREGYFEIIEMGTITNTAINAAITHVSGVPANCAVVQASAMDMGATSSFTVGGQSARANPPTGGLTGTASLINVALGTDFGYDPVALDAFAPPQVQNIWHNPRSIFPDLTFADLQSVVFNNGGVVSSNWLSGDSTVSALLMHNNIINEFVLDSATLSGTDWVITMPTKRYNVPVHNPSLPTDATQVFSPFTSKFWTNGACEPVGLSYWNREEGFVNIVDFSPPPPSGVTALCWETNVVTFNDSDLLGSTNTVNIPVNFQNGWLRMAFNTTAVNVFNGQIDGNGVLHPTASQSLTSVDGDTYIGLPTVGFMLQDFINATTNPGGQSTTITSTYGGNFNHKYTTAISNQ